MNIPLNIDWQQILLHFFNFSILVGGLYLLLFKPVKDFMAKREQHYQAIDDDAAAKLREAEEKVKSADERVAALDNELTAQRESAAKEASALAERQRATAKADKIIEAARAEGERERKKIVDDANREAVAIAEAAMDKLVNEHTSAAYDDFLKTVEGESK